MRILSLIGSVSAGWVIGIFIFEMTHTACYFSVLP